LAGREAAARRSWEQKGVGGDGWAYPSQREAGPAAVGDEGGRANSLSYWRRCAQEEAGRPGGALDGSASASGQDRSGLGRLRESSLEVERWAVMVPTRPGERRSGTVPDHAPIGPASLSDDNDDNYLQDSASKRLIQLRSRYSALKEKLGS